MKPCDIEILEQLRARKDDRLCQRAVTLIEFAIWVIKDQKNANQQVRKEP